MQLKHEYVESPLRRDWKIFFEHRRTMQSVEQSTKTASTSGIFIDFVFTNIQLTTVVEDKS